jgi:lactam utilization protein B
MSLDLTKTCKGCAQVKPLSLFHKHKQMADGHLNFCKVCFYEKAKANRAANPDSRKAEHARLRLREGFMTMAEYTAKRNENPKGKKTSAREWAQRNKPAQAAYSKQYEVANKERIQAKRAANIKMRRETKRIWVKNNLGLVLAASAARRAAKLQRTPAWLTDFDQIKIKCLYQLAAMRTRESDQRWHVDHIIPLQGAFVSGLHVPSNLRVIPALENMRKNNHYEV